MRQSLATAKTIIAEAGVGNKHHRRKRPDGTATQTFIDKQWLKLIEAPS
jgi:hypothetical protein